MATIKVDDAIYLDALSFLLDEKHAGIGEAFEAWLRSPQKGTEIGDQEELGRLFAGLIGQYANGQYNSGTPWDESKTLVWSFHRAWCDHENL